MAVVLVAVGLISLGIALALHFRLGTIANTPFKTTGELASHGAPCDRVSCQGRVIAAAPLTSPYSRAPCLYYEVLVEQEIERERSDGQRERQWREVQRIRQGSLFELDDGSGPVTINGSNGLKGDFQRAYHGMPGDFSLLDSLTTMLVTQARWRVTEWVLPVEAQLFALGSLAAGQLHPTTGVLGSLIVSASGRQELLGSTHRNRTIALVVGGAALVFAAVVAIATPR